VPKICLLNSGRKLGLENLKKSVVKRGGEASKEKFEPSSTQPAGGGRK